MARRGLAWLAAVLLTPALVSAKPAAHALHASHSEGFLTPKDFLKGRPEHLPPTTNGLHNFAAVVDKEAPAPQPAQAKHAKAATAPAAKAEQQPPKSPQQPTANHTVVPVPEGVEMVAPLEPFEEIDSDIDTAAEFNYDLSKQKMFNTHMTSVKEEDDDVVLEEQPQVTEYLSRMLNPAGYREHLKVPDKRASRAMASAVAHIKPLSRPGIPQSLAHQKFAAEAEAKATDAKEERHLSRGDAIASLHNNVEPKSDAKPAHQQSPRKAKHAAAKDQAHDRLSKVLNATDVNSTEALPAEVVKRLSSAVHLLKAPPAKAPATAWNHSGDPMATIHNRFHKEEAAAPPVMVRRAKKVAPESQKPKLLRDIEEVPTGELKKEAEAVKEEVAAIPAGVAARLARAERDPEADTGLERDLEAAQASSPDASLVKHKPKGDVMKELHEQAEQAKNRKEAAEPKAPSKPKAHAPKAKAAPASKRLGEELKAASDDGGLAAAIPAAVASQLMKAEAALEPKVKEDKVEEVKLPHSNVSDVINAIHSKVHVEPPPPASPKASVSMAAPPKVEEEDEFGFHHARQAHNAKPKRAKGDVDEALRLAAEALKDPRADKEAKIQADEEAKMPKKGGDQIEALHNTLHAAPVAPQENFTIIALEAPQQPAIPGLHKHSEKPKHNN